MRVTEGEGVYFKVKVSGVPQPTVIWYHNGEKVKADYACEIEEDGSLAIPSTELKHSGVYKAVVTNQHGSEEREVKITVDKEGESSEHAATDEIVSTSPIPILEFGKYVSELHANSNQPFKDLYQVCVYSTGIARCMSIVFIITLSCCKAITQANSIHMYCRPFYETYPSL